MDGIADVKGKWKWDTKRGASANFTLGAEATINTVMIITLDLQRAMKTFEVLVEIGGTWQAVEGVQVAGGVASPSGSVTMAAPQEEATMTFHRVDRAAAIKLVVTGLKDGKGLINEVIVSCKYHIFCKCCGFTTTFQMCQRPWCSPTTRPAACLKINLMRR